MTNYDHEDFFKNIHQIYSFEATKIANPNFGGSRTFLIHWWSYLNHTIHPYNVRFYGRKVWSGMAR
jgi:hypothetical protein